MRVDLRETLDLAAIAAWLLGADELERDLRAFDPDGAPEEALFAAGELGFRCAFLSTVPARTAHGARPWAFGVLRDAARLLEDADAVALALHALVDVLAAATVEAAAIVRSPLAFEVSR